MLSKMSTKEIKIKEINSEKLIGYNASMYIKIFIKFITNFN